MKQTTRTMKNIITFGVAVWMLLLAFSPVENSAIRPVVEGSPTIAMATCEPVSTGEYPRVVVMQRLNSGAVKSKNHTHIDKGINEVMFDKDWKNVRILGFCS